MTKPKSKSANAVDKPFAKNPPKKSLAKKPKPEKMTAVVEKQSALAHTNSERLEDEIFRERVTLIDGVGIYVAKDTPLNESGAIVDRMVSLVKKSGLYLADAMVQLHEIHGPEFLKFLQDTGRELSTLKNYLTVGSAFPLEFRKPHPTLEYTHYRGLTRLEPSQRKEMIRVIEKDEIPARKVLKIAAEKFPKPAKVSAIKPAKLSTKAKPDYQPKPSEEAALVKMKQEAATLYFTLTEPVEKDGDSWKRLLSKLTKQHRDEVADLLKPAAKLWMQIK